jgi:hypothetical protein
VLPALGAVLPALGAVLPALGAVLFKELVEEEPLAEVVEVLAKGGNLSAESPAVRRLCLEL